MPPVAVRRLRWVGWLALLLLACVRTPTPGEPRAPTNAKAQGSRAATPAREPPPRPLLLRGARVMTATGVIYEKGDVLLVGGRIAGVGARIEDAPADTDVLDVSGKTITPGIVDTHSHLGVYAAPGLTAHADGNEAIAPATPHVRAEDAYWPQDPQIGRARAGGVTTMQVLPGSANLIGGRSVTVKTYPHARGIDDARFVGAPPGLKIACGENPKRMYADKGGPSTRMGNVAGYRTMFQKAVEYRRAWERYRVKLAARKSAKGGAKRKSEGGSGKDDPPDPPARDFGLETLAAVLRGEILVHNHCYRADEMLAMLAVAREFGFAIQSFHHAVEAYKIADHLAAAGTSASVWADWWGFKAEAFDGIRENAALVAKAGGRAIIHSDSGIGIQHLNQEAAKAMWAGRRAGLDVPDDEALRWITANPASALGVLDRIGTLEKGKHADVVVWDGDPFSVYTRVERVYIEGALVYAKDGSAGAEPSDFELGYPGEKAARAPAKSKPGARTPARAASRRLPFDTDAGTTVLVGAQLMVGDGTTIENATIELKGSRIARVSAGGGAIPEGPTRIDLAGKIVTPGLVAADTMLGLVEIDLETSTRDDARNATDPVRAGYDAASALHADSALFAVQAIDGVTSAAVTPQGGLFSGKIAWIDLVAGDHGGLVSSANVGMRAALGQVVDGSRAATLQRMREVLDDVAFYRARRGAYDRRQSRDLAAHRLDLEALVPVLDRRIPLVLSAHRVSDLLALVELADQLRIDVVAVGGSQAWRVADELARARIAVIVQPSQNLPGSYDALGARLDSAALLAAAGVDVGIAVLGEAHNVRNVTQEAGLAISYGLPRDVALRAITLTLARAYGMDAHYGSIAAGKVANLVVWDGDPFELSQRPSAVWIRGRPIELRSRQTELRDRYLELGPFRGRAKK
jgi:imidazolonepropionase-like amidohydrolase